MNDPSPKTRTGTLSERRKHVLTESDYAEIVARTMSAIEARSKRRAQEREDELYRTIGKTVVRRFLLVLGTCGGLVTAWLHGSGKITLHLFGG